ncbi:ABC-type Fe3+/spermidine/putrescine transport system ATPase subunit [Rhizobium sp. BK077]|uniref:ABC transporter ATP-binding protein n=1 Tax=unclassified Rhizobium TaxID=2613769 RepID=UPI00160A2BB1|nr:MULTISPECIES: ABC transporter ATP-binding protein [unclassified Rhizobium]MBB3302196.1 ABC-type Fe3+/spermidine/putrescine transport system ATPase subunit [Rhizobium sp. BK112]MBB3371318.1 ABC-type Fe3+/spermidine/putrescine transport system ATPase subunit [Rhizobium sp. BK077]MBB4182194.1 ABC-type Fe3+/spermidine/putrescine transport system ATPase subunit [Rhizobium sp. BK109]MBB4255623.1 ABC-type Fe3+/spermidine/putrescine transport system ATPase subunit [Rhizobium sp. BK008]
MSVLNIEGARIRFGTYEALKGISVAVQEGQLVTLLGPSGCGKTTLLRAIAGFISLDEGSITIDGADMRNVPPERRNTAMCFQSYALFPHLTVFENIAFGLRQKGVRASEVESRVREAAAQVSLEAQLQKLPTQLSGGQQQRVALARALAVRPGVILFDEPLSNLDARLRDQVRFEIRQLQRAHGFTAVYVTHDQAEALAMSDLVVVMNAGQIEQAGTPHEVYYRPVSRFVADFVGTANIMPVQVRQRDAGKDVYRVDSPMGEVEIHSDEPPVSDYVYAMWRPEDAMACEQDGSANRFDFTIKAQSFLGNLTDLSVAAANSNTALRVQVLGQAAVSEGSTRTFRIDPKKIRFLKESVQ